MDLDWGEQLVRVVRKGTGAEQWLPASPAAFVWIRLYLSDLGDLLKPNDPLWWTLSRRDNAKRAIGEHGNDLLKATYKALRRIRLCPWRIGDIAAAALVLLHVTGNCTT